jgi:sec-independent protein translocase protein TatA
MFSGLLQPMHAVALLVVALVVLGPKRVSEAGRALGQGLKGFKESLAGTGERREPDGGDEDRELTGSTGLATRGARP